MIMKMKKVEYLAKIRELVHDNEEYVEFLDAEIAKLNEKAKKDKEKRAAKTGEDGEIRAAAIETLEKAGRAITLAELVAGIGDEYTVAKVVHHIKPLVDGGIVIKEKAKVGDRKIMTYKLG